MGRINRLPPELANQIAAGEVVERPASAVKELVENSLDAGAARVAVAIELGGKRLIRVEDDGEGMTPGDAELAVERHATSKIGGVDDLAAIGTLGFRGEALPSIASVSRLRLRTRARGASTGVEVRVSGGAPAGVAEAGLPEGTSVEVRDLFYNVPARRKFLKTDRAETGHISRALTQLALAHAAVGFRLQSGSRTVFHYPPAASLAERFFQVYGERPDLVDVRKEAGGIRLYGRVAALAGDAPARGPQHLFVNGRAVRDRTILHAVNEAYSRATVKPRSPEVHLFVELPPERVDVNVHPTKAEVRFLEQSLVHEVVRRAFADALGQEVVPEVPLAAARPRPPEPRAAAIPGVVAGMAAASRWAPVTEAFRTPDAAPAPPGGPADAVRESRPGAGADGSAAPGPEQAPLIPLGQFRDTFIIAVDNDGVVIVDQHVAHERILHEQVLARLADGGLESQRLLEPLLIALPAGAREALQAHAGTLARLGFEIHPFGGDSVQVTAVPGLLGRGDCEAAVRSLAEDLDGLDDGAAVGEALGRIAASTACHAAVKANDRLTLEKMTWMLRELRRTAYSTVCPHGRPVLLRLTREELEKRFERI